MTKPAVPVVLAFSLALLVAGCGGGSPSAGVAHIGNQPTTTPPAGAAVTAPASAGTYAHALAFSQCMRSHGAPNFPDPQPNGGILLQGGPGSGLDPGSAQFQAAQKTCSKYLPNGGQPSPAQQQAALARALRFSQCMRAHGLSGFPDPQSIPGGGIRISIRAGKGANSDLNPGSPIFQAAQKACQSIMGGPRPGPGQEVDRG